MQLDQLINEAVNGGSDPANNTSVTTDNTTTANGTTEPNQTPDPNQTSDPNQTGGTSNPADGTADTTTTDSDQQGKDDKTKNENKPNPMKELRDKYNSQQKESEFRSNTMERFYNGDYKLNPKDFKTEDGKIDYKALSDAMDEVDNKNKAESKGITPEMQKEIERIEFEKQENAKQAIKNAMDRAIADMQVDKGLNRQAVNQFFADAMAVKKNPYQWLAQGGSLPDLYNMIYFEKIVQARVDKAVADAEAKWKANNNYSAPTTNPASQSTDTGAKEGMSLKDIIGEAMKK